MQLSDTLKLPSTAVTQRFGFIGTIGSGKTYAATKLAEQMLDAHAQIVAIDPVGVWWGLRSAGRGTGYSIPVFGGLHGDVPLEVGAGALIADLIVDKKISAVIDLSQFEYDTDKAKFCADFGRRFFFRKNQKPSAVHLFIEEAQEVLPEEPQKSEVRMLHVFVRMAKLGRNFGIGMSLITQRPQDVSKKALNLSECVLAFKLNGTHERAAIKRWLLDKGAPDDITDKLPYLEVGHCRIVSREWLKVNDTIRIASKITADVSSTPQHGARKIKSRELSPVDLDALREKMAATIEKAKADDPAELRKEIAALKREITHNKLETRAPAAPAKIEQKEVEVPVLKPKELKQMKDDTRAICLKLGQVAKALEAAAAALPALQQQMSGYEKRLGNVEQLMLRKPALPVLRLTTRPGASITYTPEPKARELGRTVLAQQQGRAPAAGNNGDVKLGPGPRKIAICIAQSPHGATREQITAVTGFKRSSRNTYLSTLIGASLIMSEGDRLTMTPVGVEWLGNDYEPLPTGMALAEYWLERLTGGEKQIFEIVLQHPAGIDPESITESTELKRSSRNTYISKLVARQLIERAGKVIRPAQIIANP